MNRNIWLFVCLAIGLGGGFGGGGFGIGLLTNTDGGELTNILAAVLDATSPIAGYPPLVQFAVNLATSGLAAALLFILPLTLLDGFATRSAIAQLDVYVQDDPKKRKKITRDELAEMLSGSGPLLQAAKTYIASLVLHSKAANPPPNTGIVGANLAPRSAFSADALVDRALYLGFFRGLALLLPATGLTLVLLILAGANAEPDTSGFIFLVLSASVGASVIILALVGIIGAFRRQQIERLHVSLEILFPTDPWGGRIGEFSTAITANLKEIADAVRKGRLDIVKAVNAAARSTSSSVEGSMGKWQGDLAAAVEKSLKAPMSALAGDQIKGVQKLVDGTLKSVKSGLQVPMAKQVASLEKSVKSTSRIVAQTEKAFEKANSDLAMKLASHEKALSKDFAAYTEGLTKGVDSQALAVAKIEALNATVDATLEGVKPLLNRIATGQEQLLSAIENEGTAAQVINTSSRELGAAAKASRESVEQFVALAENLKAVSIALQKAGTAAASEVAENSSPAEGEDRPAELSKAIRDLKESTGRRSLPKL